MRIFFAVAFDDSMKNQLLSIQNNMRPAFKKARFTGRENLHLTMRFIGETEPQLVKKIVEKFQTSFSLGAPFSVTTDEISFFKSNLYYLKVASNPHLTQIYTQIEELLLQVGYPKEGRDFHPHITLLREGERIAELPSVTPLHYTVKEITLFESVYQNGRLAYLPIAKFSG